MPVFKISSALTAESINGYSDKGSIAKAAFHKESKSFLKKLAIALNLSAGSFSVRSNLGGVAVSGEVTLHADNLYVQLSESCTQRGVQMMYRSCESQKDFCGHTNHFVNMRNFLEQHEQTSVVSTMFRLLEAEQGRKADV
jgi:hypothetical protein